MFEPPDTTKVISALGVLIAAVVGIVWKYPSLVQLIGSDARVKAAFVQGALIASGTLFGVLLSTWSTRRAERRREASEARRVGAALYNEVVMLATFVADCAAKAVEIARANGTPTQEDFRHRLPPPPILFPALADKLPLMRREEVGMITAFYGHLNLALQLTRALPPDDAQRARRQVLDQADPFALSAIGRSKSNTDMNSVETELRAIHAWRSAAEAAILPLMFLSRHAYPEHDRGEDTELEALLTSLRNVGWPRGQALDKFTRAKPNRAA